MLEMLLQALLARLLVDMELYWLSTSPDPVGLSSVVSKSRYSYIHSSSLSANCLIVVLANTRKTNKLQPQYAVLPFRIIPISSIIPTSNPSLNHYPT